MILDIALGIVLGVLLLALIPILIVGTVAAFRWALPVVFAVAAVFIVVQFPKQTLSTLALFLAFGMLLVAWRMAPSKLAAANSRVAHALSDAHRVYFAALDGRSPYDGRKSWPLRLAATLLAITVTSVLATAALFALSVAWRG